MKSGDRNILVAAEACSQTARLLQHQKLQHQELPDNS